MLYNDEDELYEITNTCNIYIDTQQPRTTSTPLDQDREWEVALHYNITTFD